MAVVYHRRLVYGIASTETLSAYGGMHLAAETVLSADGIAALNGAVGDPTTWWYVNHGTVGVPIHIDLVRSSSASPHTALAVLRGERMVAIYSSGESLRRAIESQPPGSLLLSETSTVDESSDEEEEEEEEKLATRLKSYFDAGCPGAAVVVRMQAGDMLAFPGELPHATFTPTATYTSSTVVAVSYDHDPSTLAKNGFGRWRPPRRSAPGRTTRVLAALMRGVALVRWLMTAGRRGSTCDAW